MADASTPQARNIYERFAFRMYILWVALQVVVADGCTNTTTQTGQFECGRRTGKTKTGKIRWKCVRGGGGGDFALFCRISM